MKKIYCILSVLLMLAVSFSVTGCGENNTGTSGKTVKKLFDKPITFSLLFSEHPNQPVNVDTIKFKEITELTNVKLDIDVTTATAYANKIVSAASSGKMYDITYMTVDQMRQYNPDLYLDLTDMYEKYAPDYWKYVKDDSLNAETRIKGRYYGFSFVNANPYSANNEYGGLWPVIRADILDENGFAIPSTWDEMFNTMKKLKKLYPNSTPISGRSKYTILDTLEYSLGMYRNIHKDENTGKYVCGVLSNDYYSVLKKIKLFYDEGILDNGYESVDSASWNDGVKTGKIFFWIDNAGFRNTQNKILREKNPDASMKLIPLMKNSFGRTEGGILFTDIKYSEQWVINSKVSDPIKAVQFMNWCYTADGCNTNSFGKKGITYEVKENNSIYIPDKIASKYYNQASGAYSWMSDYGLGQLCFAPMFNQNCIFGTEVPTDKEVADEKADYELVLKDKNAGNTIWQQTVNPDVSTDIAKKADLINDYINTSIFSFINGKKPLTEFNAFVEQVKNMEVQEVLNAYNAK